MCEWTSFCREVLNNESSLKRARQISGGRKIIEIDKRMFGKRKYNLGRIVAGQWVFDGLCWDKRETYIVPVEQRDGATLLPIIKDAHFPWYNNNIRLLESWQLLTR